MLELQVGGTEWYDEGTSTFLLVDAQTIKFEHSLVSLSKWEEIWEKPFLRTDLAQEELRSYVEQMVISPEVNPSDIVDALTQDQMNKIGEYINSKKTATWFAEDSAKSFSQTIVTSELIYYWMFTAGIPKECETWHLNRLITLIRVFSEKSQPPSKRSKADLIRQRQILNAKRKEALNSSG